MVQLIVNGTVIPCRDDRDCPHTSLCYVPLPNMINDTKNSIQFDQCGCSVDTGHQGSYCDAPSVNMVYRIIVIIMFILISLYSIDSIIPDIRALMNKNNKKKFYVFSNDERVNTMAKCALTFLFTIIWKISNLVYIVDNEKIEMVEFDGFAWYKKKSLYLPFYYTTLAITIYLFASSVLDIGIMWVEVSVAIRTMKYESSKKFRKFIFVMNAMICITLLIVTIVYPFLSILVVVPFCFFLTVVFAGGAWRITSTMNIIQTNSIKNKSMNPKSIEAFQKARRGIIISAFWIISSTFGIVIFLFTSLIYYTNIRVYREPIGSIYTGAVLADISFAFVLSEIWCVIWYTRLRITDDKFDEQNKTGGIEPNTNSSSKQDGTLSAIKTAILSVRKMT